MRHGSTKRQRSQIVAAVVALRSAETAGTGQTNTILNHLISKGNQPEMSAAMRAKCRRDGSGPNRVYRTIRGTLHHSMEG